MARFVLIAVFAFALCWTQVSAQTLYVPSGEYSSIQSAIDDANNGDTIVVSAGTYQENINFLGKAITVRSVDPNDPNMVAATIIDGSNPVDPNIGSVVTFNSGEGTNSVLSGFTIQNGSGQTDPTVTWRLWTGNNGDGGGALCSGASPTITKNVFKNCRAEYGGGGIFCNNNASPIITDNTFLNNYAGVYGGAVFARLRCSPTISNNTFKENQCEYLGGAIYLADHSSSKITNNWFEKNNCKSLHAGAIYYFVNSSPTIACNFFISNTAKTTGSAINMGASTSGVIINNYFRSNAAQPSSGAAIRVSSGGNDLIANNVIVENVGVGISTESGAAPVIKNNNVWANTISNYGGILGDQTGINGNISDDPKIAPELPEPFTSFFEFNPDSSCIDAGSNDSVPSWLTSDYDGTSRVVNDVVDMGPQECHLIAVPQHFNTIQEAINAAQSGDEIVVSPGFYRENIDFLTKNIRLRSLNFLDPNCVAQTVVDGNGADSCIKILSGQDESTAVAGLWIQNGHGQFGGGIYVGNSLGPLLMYNYITNNTAFKPQGSTTGGYGGGIDCRNYAYANVTNNTIIGNFAEAAGGGVHIGPGSTCLITNNRIIDNVTVGEAGGGIYCYDKTTAWIINNEIIGNTAETACGGGIWVWESPGGIIEGKIIIGNVSIPTRPGGSDGRGGGIGLFRASTLIRNNLICGNKATEGGGIWIQYEGSNKVVNNTIVGNTADLEGAGIAVAWGVYSPIINNIIANNGSGGGIYVISSASLPSEPNIIANDLWNNEDGNYLGDINDPTGTGGNISADPGFVDAGYWDANGTPEDPNDDYRVQGDYRIGYYSPCRDSGSLDNAPETDIDAKPRPHFESFDIGAYELQIYDLVATGSVDFADLLLLVESWLDEGPSTPGDLNADGLVDFRDFALLSSDWLK
ncbi:MAG: right-handed parallel beta-helix repeat-containing protein [Sedimentisphaerales bacterium]|nr:right-handed parallel beta-helix repeat-containing protein [Sedimentisphaerales bacterium]